MKLLKIFDKSATVLFVRLKLLSTTTKWNNSEVKVVIDENNDASVDMFDIEKHASEKNIGFLVIKHLKN